MQKTLLFKILIILALTVLICVPLSMIDHTIKERGGFRAEAVASIAENSVREQTIIGPIVAVQYTEEYEETVAPTAPATKSEVVTRSVTRQHLVFPNDLTVNGKINTFRRYRGIHQVLSFSGKHELSGDFLMPSKKALPTVSSSSRVTINKTSIAIGIEDVRGIKSIPHINWNGTAVEFEQGTGLNAIPNGLHADLGPLPADGGKVAFSFAIGLDGTERQQFAPVGKNNKFTISSNWPHPQFAGSFLPAPDERTINDQGFSATWNIAHLSNNAQRQLAAMERSGSTADPAARSLHKVDSFSIGFIEPVNVYSMAERATKYGLLFVALTFAAFFMFEILKLLPIHPVQYMLVGLALVLFFLLLVALSEHIVFWQAYLIASGACIVLIGYYLSAVLGDWRRAAGFASALTALYGALYGLLISENNALVLGSLLLFAVLGTIMVATRKVDWYKVGRPIPLAE